MTETCATITPTRSCALTKRNLSAHLLSAARLCCGQNTGLPDQQSCGSCTGTLRGWGVRCCRGSCWRSPCHQWCCPWGTLHVPEAASKASLLEGKRRCLKKSRAMMITSKAGHQEPAPGSGLSCPALGVITQLPALAFPLLARARIE